MFLKLLVLFAVAFGVLPQTSNHTQLKSQVKSYHGHFSAGRYDRMWEMSSKDFKDRNDNNKEGYISYLQKTNFGAVKSRISQIKIAQNRAVVTLNLSVWSNRDRKWVKEVVLEEWVLEEQTWRFDRQLRQTKTKNKDHGD